MRGLRGCVLEARVIAGVKLLQDILHVIAVFVPFAKFGLVWLLLLFSCSESHLIQLCLLIGEGLIILVPAELLFEALFALLFVLLGEHFVS